MTLVSGPLSTVTTSPSAVTQVEISINTPRTTGTGLMTAEQKIVAVTGGNFSSQIAPGPAALSLIVGGRKSTPIPILVDDAEAQTLANAVNAAKVATPDNKEWLEKLAAEVIAGTQGPMGEPGPVGPQGDPGPTGTLDLIDESVQTTIDTVVVPAIEGARDEALGKVAGAVAAEIGNTTHIIATGTNVHANKVVRLNAQGKLAIYTGMVTVGTDPTNKTYVDVEVGKKADRTHTHNAADITGTTEYVNFTDDDRFANRLVRLNSSGKLTILTAGITGPNDPVNKQYVDNATQESSGQTSWWN